MGVGGGQGAEATSKGLMMVSGLAAFEEERPRQMGVNVPENLLALADRMIE
jgi:hypothetical protein